MLPELSETKPIRVVFMGTPSFAVASLTALCERPDLFEVVGVVTQPDRPAGRKQQLTAPPVKVVAQARGLPVQQWTKLRDGRALAAIEAWRPDVIVVAAYGRILPLPLLEAAPHGCVNVHASLLPAWRGASPIAQAIWHGDAHAGVCIMAMDEGMDTGGVYARAQTEVSEQETCGSLTVKLAELGATLLVQTLPQICQRRLHAKPQPEHDYSLAPLLQKSDGALDFAQKATYLARQVRALDPWPGTFCFFEGERVAVLQAHVCAQIPANQAQEAKPGTVLAADKRGLCVACGKGALWLTQVKPAGKAQMDAGSWIAGRGPKKGATLSMHGGHP